MAYMVEHKQLIGKTTALRQQKKWSAFYNDLLLAADRGEETVLVMLDYSSAFDTIDHDIMLHPFFR